MVKVMELNWIDSNIAQSTILNGLKKVYLLFYFLQETCAISSDYLLLHFFDSAI